MITATIQQMGSVQYVSTDVENKIVKVDELEDFRLFWRESNMKSRSLNLGPAQNYLRDVLLFIRYFSFTEKTQRVSTLRKIYKVRTKMG